MPRTLLSDLQPAARSRRARVVEERRDARIRFARLRELSPSDVLSQLAREARRPTWGLFARFLTESRKSVHRRPQESHRWAQVAARLAERLDRARYPRLSVRDLLAAASAAEAEALRFLGRPQEAEGLLDEARRLLSSRPDPRLRAEIERIGAGLRGELADPSGAERLFTRAILRLQSMADPSLIARLYAERSAALAGADPFQALETVCFASFLAGNRCQRQHAELSVVFARFLCETGSPSEAAVLLGGIRDSESRELEPLGRVHGLWVQARIDRQRGNLPRAERRLHQVIEHLSSFGRDRDRALARLDLAEVEMAAGRPMEGIARLRRLEVDLAMAGGHGEISVALALLAEACSDGETFEPLFVRARLYLLRCWWAPQRSRRREGSHWANGEVPFGLEAQAISRAGTDYLTFEAPWRRAARPQVDRTELFAHLPGPF